MQWSISEKDGILYSGCICEDGHCKVTTIENKMSVWWGRSPGRSTHTSARIAGTFRCGHHRGLFLLHTKDQLDIAVDRSAS